MMVLAVLVGAKEDAPRWDNATSFTRPHGTKVAESATGIMELRILLPNCIIHIGKYFTRLYK